MKERITQSEQNASGICTAAENIYNPDAGANCLGKGKEEGSRKKEKKKNKGKAGV